MSASNQPLVSVITPVYNGGPYFAECIESILAQTYSNWEYTIVNNCSTDGTLQTAEEYARRDRRIRVVTNETFLDIIGNANRACSLISPDSKYCKNVSADDWLMPECLSKMVALAEAHPSIGVVGSYQVSGGSESCYVRTDGLPVHSTFISGREICRAHLLTSISVFGNPTSSMYRADLVRKRSKFYPNLTAEADVSAIFDALKESDFGFVHQVLSYERVHNLQITATSQDMNAYLSSKLGDLLTYGPFYLSPAELSARIEAHLDTYYTYLAIAVVNRRDKKFWAYHKRRLAELGYPLNTGRLAKALSWKLCDLLLNPMTTVQRIARRSNGRG